MHHHKRMGSVVAVIIAVVGCVVGILPPKSTAQPLAKGKDKFLGCSLSDTLSSFATYWNQVTPENAGKWGSVEGTQGIYNWTPLDVLYDYAMTRDFRYKHTNLVWGNQQPSWITSLDSAGQRAAVENWIQLLGARYPSMSFINVVNEPLHTPPPYMNALGGRGKTGWDWVVTVYTLARKYCATGVQLLLNEFAILQSDSVTDTYLQLIDTLRVRGLIDGIGIQGHYFEFKSAAGVTPVYTYSITTIKSNLDRIAAKGLPVYISEFDINEPNDSTQLQNYKTYFPLFWEDPGVKGFTLWGYVQNDIWQPNAYLIRVDGSERPALQWLRRYLASPAAPATVSPIGTTGEPRNPLLVWHSVTMAALYHLQLGTNSSLTSIVVDTTTADTVLRVNPLTANSRFFWHVSAVNDSGASSYSATGTFVTGNQVTSVHAAGGTPMAFSLSQNYPNPFNPSTTIRYGLPQRSQVTLSVFNGLGQRISTMLSGTKEAGFHEVRFDGTILASGMYFYRLQAGSFVETMKMLILR